MDLTTVANVRAYTGLTTDDISDVNLGLIVTRASEIIREYCSRDITNEGPYTETFDGNGGAKWLPVQWPLTAVTSITVDGVPVQAATSVTSSGYRFNRDGIVLNGYSFGKGLLNCEVTYGAGESPVPASIEQACIIVVWEMYNAACRDPAIRADQLKGTYHAQFEPMVIPVEAKAILDQSPYVRRWS